jgi:hypothetical protein
VFLYFYIKKLHQKVYEKINKAPYIYMKKYHLLSIRKVLDLTNTYI